MAEEKQKEGKGFLRKLDRTTTVVNAGKQSVEQQTTASVLLDSKPAVRNGMCVFVDQ